MIASAVLHLAALLFILHVRRMHIEPARLPGTALGSRISMTYSPGNPHVTAAVKPLPSQVHSKATAVVATSSVHPTSAQGGDALGQGNVTVALATFFPTPKPDLSQLPHGTRGDVVVDVVIDEQGKIVDAQLAQTLGHGVDETVLATIQTWTFKPATKDGVAVPSQQELLFHYERG
jgi:protein TonB